VSVRFSEVRERFISGEMDDLEHPFGKIGDGNASDGVANSASVRVTGVAAGVL
jgi:hypothetical protein